MATHKVGGEVDAFCTRCKMTLAHTILAMVGSKVARVRCNTCGGDHAYRGAPGTTAGTPKKPARAASTPKVVVGWTERLAARNPAAAKKYSVKETFQVEDLIDHPTFGLGIVEGVRGDKVDVAFKTELKTLMHARSGGLSTEKPKYAPPPGAIAGPADKPMQDEAGPGTPEAG